MRLTDIHCHLLPKVDDGAKNEEEALKLLEMEYA
ncbi:MAG: capsular biosynthesis protein, partial [Lachnospiraceae bacterium]|nr:capsular biosynthesis protein [Lachnospiraceae bacterium]